MFWSPGTNKFFTINTNNGSFEEQTLDSNFNINALATQALSSSVYAVISLKSNQSDVGVYQIIRGSKFLTI